VTNPQLLFEFHSFYHILTTTSRFANTRKKHLTNIVCVSKLMCLLKNLTILVILSIAKLNNALEHCSDSTDSVYGHGISSHVISTTISLSLSECVMICRNELRCKSLNFRLKDKSCDLNDADRHTQKIMGHMKDLCTWTQAKNTERWDTIKFFFFF